ncbi:MAG: 2-isopropylmalate synthase [Anaerovoracaceae bacterium]
MRNYRKYKTGYYMPPVCEMEWVKKERIQEAPKWCSVDLRDGNQALIVPMSLTEKLEYFKFLVDIGFKEIEVGFPASSETEHDFVRALIENDLIPDDVRIQVLTQSRDHIIKETFKSLKGAKKAIVHLYNSTSHAQREQVFKMGKEEIRDIAVKGAKLFNKYQKEMADTDFQFQYSPESFTGTEMEFALEICNAVIDIWKPYQKNKIIINLPATVSMSMPHVYASQIEYMCKNLNHREDLIISLHPHNDRGTAVADSELGILAGADRIEGTLFGNGERTGNVDIVTLAMNMFSHGVDPKLDFSNMPEIVRMSEKYTNIPVHPRQPYGGKLVFAAFSGSHQDAISKGMKWRRDKKVRRWTVPYLPIDPKDVGREYEADVIRINSQSGKGGVAYILEENYGFIIPERMRQEVGYLIKDLSDKKHKELTPSEVEKAFRKEYVNIVRPITINEATFKKNKGEKKSTAMSVSLDANIKGKDYHLEASGNGRLDAVANALKSSPYPFNYNFVTYLEHAMEQDSDSRAASYVAISDETGRVSWGVGIHEDIVTASINALVTALNRMDNNNHFI